MENNLTLSLFQNCESLNKDPNKKLTFWLKISNGINFGLSLYSVLKSHKNRYSNYQTVVYL